MIPQRPSSQSPVPANILVVDDTIENLQLLSSMLGKRGYEVRPVTNGRQALQAIERDPPDLVLLDITMPEMNGYEVCAALKANPALKDVPVIFLTALDDVADKVRAFEVGGIDYITKPFQLEEVQARVSTQLSLRRAALELSRNYERLGALEKLRDNLVHMIVHDMRSPLSVLLGHLELLRDGAASALNDDGREDLEAAMRAARILNRMANDLLDVSRLEEGRLPLNLQRHDLCALVEDVVSELRSLERGRQIEVQATGDVAAECDREITRRVLENLIVNAIKHTPSGAKIVVALSSDGGSTRVEVRDRGQGVPVDARSHIFEKFGVVTTRAQGKYHSVGLGLAFCKLAVEAHGGQIGVLAAEPQGSIFWFSLPAGR